MLVVMVMLLMLMVLNNHQIYNTIVFLDNFLVETSKKKKQKQKLWSKFSKFSNLWKIYKNNNHQNVFSFFWNFSFLCFFSRPKIWSYGQKVPTWHFLLIRFVTVPLFFFLNFVNVRIHKIFFFEFWSLNGVVLGPIEISWNL